MYNADIAVTVGAGGAGGYGLVAVVWLLLMAWGLSRAVRDCRESDARDDAAERSREVWR